VLRVVLWLSFESGNLNGRERNGKAILHLMETDCEDVRLTGEYSGAGRNWDRKCMFGGSVWNVFSHGENEVPRFMIVGTDQ
jgi:hypothetical protein